MYQLIYQSVRRPGLSRNELKDIAERSVERNTAVGISGVLLLQDDTVLQVIEGEEIEVRALYHRISQDTRHGGCTVLLTRHTEERSFPNWKMGFCDIDEDGEDQFRMTISALRARQRHVDNCDSRRRLAS